MARKRGGAAIQTPLNLDAKSTFLYIAESNCIKKYVWTLCAIGLSN
jgi:hypothetical protein